MKNLLLVIMLLLAGCRLFGSSDPIDTPQKDGSQPDAALDMGDATDMNGPDQVETDMAPVKPVLPSRAVEERVTEGLLFEFDFSEGTGTTAVDRLDPNFRLEFTEGVVSWIAGRNGIEIDGAGFVTTQVPPTSLRDSVVRRESASVELWVEPENLIQTGPSRMFTISTDSGNTNLTIGQDRDQYSVRFRHDRIDAINSTLGYPMVFTAIGSATLAETHIVMTFDGVNILIYLNGVIAGQGVRTGSLESWNPGYLMGLGNEFVDSRNWAGKIFGLAAYNRALSSDEVRRNFLVGSEF